MPSETSKGSCCCSRKIWIICLAFCGVVFLVSGLVFSVGGVFSNIINQQVDKVNTGKTGCNQKYVSAELFSVHNPHYPASRGPSIFLDKSERGREVKGSFENESLENEDRSTKHPNLENGAPKTPKRSTHDSKTEHPNLENGAPKSRKRSTQTPGGVWFSSSLL